MSAPPGATATTTPCGEQITAEGDLDLSTTNGQKRFLMEELGFTRPQAARMIAAYHRDLERPVVTAARSYRASFIDWLMRQAPGGRKPKPVRKREWAVAS